MTEEKKEETNTSVKITDIYDVAKAMEIAIDRMVFSQEEIERFYPSWNSVLRFCEDVRRKTKVEEAYKKKAEEEAKVNETEVLNLNASPEAVESTS